MEIAEFDKNLKDKILKYYRANKRFGFGLENSEEQLTQVLSKYSFLPNNYKTLNPNSDREYDKFLKEIKENFLLLNTIGYIEFNLLAKIENRIRAKFFELDSNWSSTCPTSKEEKSIESMTKIVAEKFGLKTFCAYWNPELSNEENMFQITQGINNVVLELKNIKEKLQLKDSKKLGNNIIGIEFNWLSQNQGMFNFYDNNIVLSGYSNFPLTHEYTHALDKITASLIISEKTPKELFESKEVDKENIAKINMNSLKQISYDFNFIKWLETKQFNDSVLTHLKNNDYFNSIFYSNNKKINNRAEFQKLTLSYIQTASQNIYPNKATIYGDLVSYFKNKTEINLGNYNDIEKSFFFRIFNYINNQDNEKTVHLNAAQIIDSIEHPKDYLIKQPEFLARTMEKIIGRQSGELNFTEIITTPVLDKTQEQRFIKILNSWLELSCYIIEERKNTQLSTKIKNKRNKINVLKKLDISPK